MHPWDPDNRGYHSCSEGSFNRLKAKAALYSHELVVGNFIDVNNPWQNLIQQSFSWARTPEGDAYWTKLWAGGRPVTDKDVGILFDFYEVNVREVTIEDII